MKKIIIGMFIFFGIFIINITNGYSLPQKDKDKIEIVVDKYINDENNKNIILKKLKKIQPKLKKDTREYEIVSLLIKSLSKKITVEDFYDYRNRYDQVVEIKGNKAIVMKHISGIKQYGVIDLKGNEILPIGTSLPNGEKVVQIKIKNPNTEECVDLSGLFGETPKTNNDCMIIYDKATEISKLSDNLYSFLDTSNQKYGFTNSSGTIIQTPIYNEVYYNLYQGKYIVAQKNGLFGLLDLNLNIIVDFKYADIQTTGSLNNKLVVKNDKLYIGLIDIANSGKEILPIKYLEMSVYNNFIVVGEKKDGSFGYADIFKVLDNNLKEIARYDRVFESDGVIFLEKNKKVGIMNKDGKILFSPKYNYDNIKIYNKDYIYGELGNRILIEYNKTVNIYDFYGNIIQTIPVYRNNLSVFPTFYENIGILIFSDETPGFYGIYDVNRKKKVIPAKYSDIKIEGNYYTMLNKNGYSEVYDSNYNLLLTTNKKGHLKHLGDNFFSFSNSDNNFKVSIIDINNNVIIPEIIDGDYLYYLGNNLFIYKENGYYGVKDVINNKIIIPFEYSSLVKDDIHDNYLIAEKDHYYGIIDLNNKIIAPLEYQELYYFDTYNTFITNKDGKKGYLYNDGFFKVIGE